MAAVLACWAALVAAAVGANVAIAFRRRRSTRAVAELLAHPGAAGSLAAAELENTRRYGGLSSD